MFQKHHRALVIAGVILCLFSFALAYSDGSGTATDPYQIACANDLLALSGTSPDCNKCFILTADIDMESRVFTTAIIAGTFTGTFDGNSHKITNFTINGESNSSLGLFRRIDPNGSVKNLGLENFAVNGGYDSGAYDSNTVEVYAGGWGADSSNANMASNITFLDDQPINIKGTQTVTKIQYRCRPRAGNTATKVRFKIFSLSGGTWTAVHDINVTAEFELLAKNASEQILTKTGSWTLTKGTYYFGVYFDSGLAAGTGTFNTGMTGMGTLYYKSGDQNSITSPSTVENATLPCAIYISTPDRILYDSSIVVLGRTAIPAYTTKPYHITLEEVNGLDNEEAFTIALEYSAIPSGTASAETIDINFVSDVNLISMVTGAKSRTITEAEGNNVTIDIWIDPVNDKIDVMYFNYVDGQGSTGGDRDVRALSVSARSPVSLTNSIIKRVNLTQVGSGIAVKRMIVHREPVLVMGDSFCSTNIGGKTVLANVGQYLDDSGYFTYQRYVYNGGVTGSKVLIKTSVSTAIKDRWKSATSEWCGMRDCTVIFVNGPGLNDVQNLTYFSTAAEINDLATRLVAAITVMAKDARDSSDANGGKNDIILCGQAAYTASIWTKRENELACQIQVNNGLMELAHTLDVPFYDSWNIKQTPNGHPTTSGGQVYARGIVDAYEGIAGGLAGSNCGSISNCYSTGNVSGYGNVGGLAGSNCGSISNCYSAGNVSGYGNIGGLVGRTYYGIVSNCYSISSVSSFYSSPYVGGLVGYNSGGDISHCYFLATSEPNNGNGTPLTDMQMKQQSSFTEWDFNTPIWEICQGTNYPKLTCQTPLPGDFVCPDGVGVEDLLVLCEQWLIEGLPADIEQDGIVNFIDYADFANDWQGNMAQLSDFASQWLTSVTYQADIAPAGSDGVVNMLDFAVFAENWLEGQ